MIAEHTIVVSWFTLGMLGAAVVYDIKSGRIPNWLTFPTMALGAGFHLYTGGLQAFLLSLAGLLTGSFVLIGFYMLGGMGAGDVKLMGAIGALMGPRDVLFAALYTGIAGGFYSLFLIFINRVNKTDSHIGIRTENDAAAARAECAKATSLRYGIAIAAGTLVLLVQNRLLWLQ